MRARSIVLPSCLALTASLLTAPAVASRLPDVACGDVISGAAVLRHDLDCTGDAGLTLLDGAHLDLRGHRLVGEGGVGLTVPATGTATVVDGELSGWATAVDVAYEEFPEGGLIRLEGLTFRHNDTAVRSNSGIVGTAQEIQVHESRFEANTTGVSNTFYGGLVAVSSSVFTANGIAVHADTGSVELTDVRLEQNGTGVSCVESWCTLLRIEAVDNDRGVLVASFGAAIHESTFIRNDVAVLGGGSWGVIEVGDSTFEDNGTAVDLDSATVALTGSTFEGNDIAFTAAGEDMVTPSTLQWNRFVGNGDGILSVTPGAEVGWNTAVRNTRWGIHAPGAVDLGGNAASRNGNEPQCVGVVCRKAS